MKFFLVSSCILLLGIGLNAEVDEYSKCLNDDSLTCLQLSFFRKAKSLLDSKKIEVFEGVSLVKSDEGRQGKSIEDNSIAVETAPSVEARNKEMATYFMEKAKNFIEGRSLNLNLAATARSVARAIPDDIKSSVGELVTEARTLKKKKSLKKLLPLIKIVGVKIALIVAAAFLHILITAKKALFIASIAFVLSLVGSAGAFTGLLGKFTGFLGGGGKGAIGSSAGHGHTATYIVSSEPAGGYSSGSYGYSAGNASPVYSSSGSGWDSSGAYSGNVAQYSAYRGQPQAQAAQQQ